MSNLEELIERLCPDGVEYKILGDISCKISDGMHNLPKNIKSSGEYPILSAQNITNGNINIDTSKWVNHEIFERENKRNNVEKGDVLLTIVGAIGRTAVVKDNLKALFQRSVCVIKPNVKLLNSKFLYYVLNSTVVQSYIQNNAKGAAQKGLYLKQVAKIKLPVPPLEVQREIVRILDNFTFLTTELAAELAARQKQYEYYRDLLLTFKPNESTILNERTNELELSGAIRWMKLGDIADIGTGNGNTNEGLDTGKYPFFVRSQDIKYKNEYDFDETAIITSGDGVGVGKIFHFVSGKYALHQRAYRVHITSDSVLPKYFFYYFKNSFLTYISKASFHSSVTSIRRPMMINFPVPVPPLEVQQRIVDILDRFDTLCNDITSGLPAEIEARQKQYEYYRDKLLTFKELKKEA